MREERREGEAGRQGQERKAIWRQEACRKGLDVDSPLVGVS